MKFESESIIWFYRYFLIIAIVFFVVIMVGNIPRHFDARETGNILINEKLVSCINNAKNIDKIDEKIFACAGLNEKDNSKHHIKIIINSEPKKLLEFGSQDISFNCEGDKKTSFCSKQNSWIISDEKPILIETQVDSA